MPRFYRKRTYYRKRNYRKRQLPWYSRKYSAFDIARKAYSATKYIKSMLNTERKFIDTSVTTAAVMPLTGVVHQLTPIAHGDLANNRSGRQVKLSSLHIKLTLFIGGAGLDSSRILIVKSKTNQAPTLSTIIDVNGDPTYSFRNLDTVRDYKVIYDKAFVMTTASTTEKHIEIHKKLSNKVQWEYNSNTIEYGHIYLILCSNQAASEPSYIYNSRVRFVDN